MEKPKGRRGSWFAEWNGESLPCVHVRWTKGIWPHHCDPCVDENPKWNSFIDALGKGRAILTDDHLSANGIPTGRKGYIALWTIDNIEVRANELHFDFAERLENF